MKKNPFKNEDPEWILFENWIREERLVETHLADADASQRRAQDARAQADRIRALLERLGVNFGQVH